MENKIVEPKKYNVMILSGGMDCCHDGHIRMFQDAKRLADIVIVGLNSDAWLTRKKGKPFMTFEVRRAILEEMRSIDRVWGFNDDDGTATDLIRRVHGLVSLTKTPLKVAFGNGGDRSKVDAIPTAEAVVCKELGIDMVFGVGGDEKLNSSSWLIARAKEEAPKV